MIENRRAWDIPSPPADLRLPGLPGELEVRHVVGPVVQPDDQLPAGARPGLIGLPDVDVPVGGSVVGEAARAGRDGLLDRIEETVPASSSSLSYDASANRYVYVWKTDKAWSGTCRKLIVRLNDGTDHVANFKFTR